MKIIKKFLRYLILFWSNFAMNYIQKSNSSIGNDGFHERKFLKMKHPQWGFLIPFLLQSLQFKVHLLFSRLIFDSNSVIENRKVFFSSIQRKTYLPFHIPSIMKFSSSTIIETRLKKLEIEFSEKKIKFNINK